MSVRDQGLLGLASVSVFALVLCAQPPVPAAADRPVPPREAAARMTLPPGFKATLFAGEPDLVQPIAFTIDDRGRLWVVECHSYPKWLRQGQGRDRVLIFEDADGDGRFDRRTVFLDNGTNLSGIQYGFGGVWLCSTPNLIFIPDRDGDDLPDGPAEVLLDGWSLDAKHNVFNSLTWGPDGWLYGTNGILATSSIGKPGTPEEKRVKMNCGVWRFHPTRRKFEVVAHGTTNPWGLDFDEHGEMFITNCVIDHLWHVAPGGHYERMYGQDLNPHVYQLMKSCCDHIHWAGGPWQTSRGNDPHHSDHGGGHAHSGCMIYLGDNWPDPYRGRVFMCNIHGNRVNQDRLERKGSGFVALHDKDFLFANDSWFRGLAIQYGPDGGVYVSDWCDTGECHNYEVADTSNGRIFKIVYGQPMPFQGDLAKRSDAELVELQLHKNDWFVRHARRLLQERAAAGKLEKETPARLRKLLDDHPDVTRKLRGMWALYSIGAWSDADGGRMFAHADEWLRAWAVRFHSGAQGSFSYADPYTPLTRLAKGEESPLVRRYLASKLQQLNPVHGALLAIQLGRRQDAADANLPLLIWYGIEPHFEDGHALTAAQLLPVVQIPLLREFLARRIALLPRSPKGLDPFSGMNVLLTYLLEARDAELELDLLRGLHAAYLGRRSAPMPPQWPAVYEKLSKSPAAEVRERAQFLAVIFGDNKAISALKELVQNRQADATGRASALKALLQREGADLVPVLQGLLSDSALRGAAIRGLAAFADQRTPGMLLEQYARLSNEEKADTIQTLTSRPAYALALLDAMERGTVPRGDLTAFTVRQLLAMKNKELTARVNKVWGTIRPASAEKAARIQELKQVFTPDYLASADLSNGRTVFARTCATCHKLFDEGAKIGPELTGSQRANLDYVLENLLDPSAAVPGEYQMQVFSLKNGRTVAGIVQREDAQLVAVQTPNELVFLLKTEIEERARSGLSMMPEGLHEPLTKEELRDLIGYLASPRQVPAK